MEKRHLSKKNGKAKASTNLDERGKKYKGLLVIVYMKASSYDHVEAWFKLENG